MKQFVELVPLEQIETAPILTYRNGKENPVVATQGFAIKSWKGIDMR